MKRVILTVGMRGSGKTTFCNKIKEQHPTVGLISWDRWYKENFPDWEFDAYSSDGPIATEILWRHITDVLSAHRQPLIIDRWLPTPERRQAAIIKLCKIGVEFISCWHFVTPPELCHKRFSEREFGSKAWGSLTKEHLFSIGQDDNRFFQPVSEEEVHTPGKSNANLDPSYFMDRREFRFDEVIPISVHQLTFQGMPLI